VVGSDVNTLKVVARVLGVQPCSASPTVGVSVVATVLDATNLLGEAECARVTEPQLDCGIDTSCSNRIFVTSKTSVGLFC
jgi:hypothetical protein